MPAGKEASHMLQLLCDEESSDSSCGRREIYSDTARQLKALKSYDFKAFLRLLRVKHGMLNYGKTPSVHKNVHNSSENVDTSNVHSKIFLRYYALSLLFSTVFCATLRGNILEGSCYYGKSKKARTEHCTCPCNATEPFGDRLCGAERRQY